MYAGVNVEGKETEEEEGKNLKCETKDDYVVS